jgi:GDPmannose 4,6-dehydratase
MLQQDLPEDFVIATGEKCSVKDFVVSAFDYVGLDPDDFVEQNPKYMRPADVDVLQGDFTKAERKLGWFPLTQFSDLVEMMVQSDLERVEKGVSYDTVLSV